MAELSPTSTAEPDELRFASTQMQGIHEEFAEKDRNQQRKLEVISRMQLFKNEEEEVSQSISVSGVVKKRTIPSKKPRKKKKLASLNEFVRDNLGSNTMRKSDSNLCKHISILDYFSGDKKKLNEILLRIEREEQNTSQQNGKSQSEPPMGAGRTDSDIGMLYTKEEWFEIIKNIKLRFPKLSLKTKRTLKTITKRIEVESKNDTQHSMWSQASALPSDDLTPEDLKWLYDLDEEDMKNEQSFLQDDLSEEDMKNDQSFLQDDLSESRQPFVMTLSQAFDDDKVNAEENGVLTDDDEIAIELRLPDTEVPHDTLVWQRPQNEVVEEVEDSESEPEIIELSSVVIDNWKKKQSSDEPDDAKSRDDRLDLKQEISSHQPIPTQDFESNSLMSALSNFLKAGEDSYSLQSELIKIESDDPKAVDSDDSVEVFSSSQINYKEEEELIVSSPTRPETSNSEFKTPTKKSKQLLMSLSSPSKLILPIKRNLQQVRSLYSPVEIEHDAENEEIIISSEESGDEEEFSTAKMEMGTSVPQVLKSFDSVSQMNMKKSRKIFATSKVEIKGNLEVNDDLKYSIRKIATHVISIDSEEEVADSEDEEKETSIIEVTVPVEEETNGTVVQVPSSPSQYLISIESEEEGVKAKVGEESAALPDIRTDTETEVTDPNTQTSTYSECLRLMSVKELKAQFEGWGLKPKSKSKMLGITQNFLTLMNPDQTIPDHQLLCKTQKEFRHQIYDTLTETLRTSRWFEKIISYEPLSGDELHLWLTQKTGVEIDRDFFDNYCDELGITCTAASTKNVY